MIDPTTERLIRLADVPKLKWLPARETGRPLHLSTLYRWVQRGLRGIHLETIQVGGTECTTEDALLRFFYSLGRRAEVRSPPERRRRHVSRAERLLDRAGIR